jgi:hypothetical protein
MAQSWHTPSELVTFLAHAHKDAIVLDEATILLTPPFRAPTSSANSLA